MDGDLWTALGGISMIGLAFAFWIPMINKKSSLRGWRYVCLAGVLFGSAGTIAFAPHPQDAVVQQLDTALLISPIEKAETTSRLEVGDTVRIVKHHGDYAYVRTQDGDQGWVDMGQLNRYVH